MKNLVLITATAIILLSCDCIQQVSGTIVDKETKEPISEVSVRKRGKNSDQCTTNPKGEFEIKSISGGLFRCLPMKIVLTKEGYKVLEVKGGGTIELVKLKE